MGLEDRDLEERLVNRGHHLLDVVAVNAEPEGALGIVVIHLVAGDVGDYARGLRVADRVKNVKPCGVQRR